MHSSAITPVFYNKKLNGSGIGDLVDLQLENILGDVNWGDATDLIKHEGFYMFGGKKVNNESSNTFMIIKVYENKKTPGVPVFKIIKPRCLGLTPTARYMHSFNFMPKIGAVILYGGRNDFLPEKQILGDIHILKIHNLEWVKARIGGEHLPIPRSHFASYVSGSELVISGG